VRLLLYEDVSVHQWCTISVGIHTRPVVVVNHRHSHHGLTILLPGHEPDSVNCVSRDSFLSKFFASDLVSQTRRCNRFSAALRPGKWCFDMVSVCYPLG
jgi:hypothetical protein